MGLGTALKNELLDDTFSAAGTAPVANHFVALSTAPPLDDGSGVAEPAGGAYARVAVVNNVANWPVAVLGVKENGNNITFPAATADWGTITHWAIFDALVAGNFICWGTLQTPRTILNGDTFRFLAGDLTMTLTSA